MALSVGDIIINEYVSTNNSSGNDYFELLVLANNADLRGLRVSDNEVTNAATGTLNANESVFVFGTDSYLASVPRGTLIVVWTITTGVTVDTDSSDYSLTLVNGTGVTASVDGLGGSVNSGLSSTAEALYVYLPGPDGTSAGTDNIYLDFVGLGPQSSNTNAVAPTGITSLVITSTNFANSYFTGNTAAASDSSANWTNFALGANWTSASPGTPGAPNAGQDLSALRAPAAPSVNLSVNANAGTEASATSITVTATAASAVTGDQTVTITVTGSNITTGDYTLNSATTNTATITILSGQTTGTATFKVVDDALVEGTETATLTISNPSSGVVLGTTTTQNITITDNDSLPTVNLSVDSNTGTEAGATSITVTATASAAVSGDQTVSVTVSGTGITTGDYRLNNAATNTANITILNGQTTGTATFKVVDDVLVESAETAVLTLSGPSSGISLGTTLTQNVVITDNDVAGGFSYSTAPLNEARALDGAVSGKIVITLTGDTLTGATNENLVSTSKVSVTNVPTGLTAVVTQVDATHAELTFTGSATSNSADVNNITITFADSALASGNAAATTGYTKSDLAINFADAGTPGTVQTFTPNVGTTVGSSDASTALALDANWMVVGDDEANVLRVYSREGGAAVAEYSFASIDPLLATKELDLEASTRIGDTLYFIGSHSNNKSGVEENNREFVFSVAVSGTGAQTQFAYQGKFGGLEGALSTWDSTNAHGKGASYFGFTASAAAGVVPEGVNGFSIEGLTASQDGTQLLLAFRAPESSTTTRDKAIIVPVAVAGLLNAGGSGTASFGAPIELDLGGRGIRSIEKSLDGNGYLILAGPAGSASADVTNDFHLFRWDGVSTTPTELNVNLDSLRDVTGGSFETIVDVINTSQGTLVQLLQDNGDTVWTGKSITANSKDLPVAEQQFQGNWVSLGADFVDNAGPVLKSASPADDATAVGTTSNLVLHFDEGVHAGSGNFVIKKVSDGSVVETIAANSAKVTVAYNTVTIDPATVFEKSTNYYLEADATAVLDHLGNASAGLSGSTSYNFTTVAPIVPPKLLITEVASNSNGGDFFELYNYGTTTIDLTGWRWDDDSANFSDATSAAFASGTTIAAGAKLLVTVAATDTALRTAWNNLSASIAVTATGTNPGLGAGDAVVVFDAAGNMVTAFNYKGSNITASDGTVISSVLRTDGNALAATSHSGVAVGASANTITAVWDERTVNAGAVKYTFATVGQFGAVSQTASATSVGSPGNAVGASITTAYTESFMTGLGEFTAVSVDSGSTSKTWFYNSTTKTADVNGFISANSTVVANDWLISKGFNLALTDIEYLSFTTYTQFADTATPDPEVKVRYSNNYSGTGSPLSATWTDLSYSYAAANSQVTTPSGLVDLSSIAGTNVYFAFQYTSSGGGSNTSSLWRLDDVKLQGYSGAVVSVQATDAVKGEGDTATTPFTFTVTRAGPSVSAATVDYTVSSAAADAADFGGSLPSGQVSFAANETSKTITINVSADTAVEANESFTVTLSNASAGVNLGQTTAVGTIQNDDFVVSKIHDVQGSGSASPVVGTSVAIEGIITAWMPGLSGFYVQEEAADYDSNAATSEGVFVYYGNTVPTGLTLGSVGDVVRVAGTVTEFKGETEIGSITFFQTVTDNATGTGLPTPVQVKLPVASLADLEALEGMLVEVSSATNGGKLVVTDNYNLGRYGEVTLTSDDLLLQYAETNTPSTSGYSAYTNTTQKDQIILSDGNTSQNPDPEIFGRGGNPLSASNTLRAGDYVGSVVGVIDQYIGTGGIDKAIPVAYETTYYVQTTATVNFAGDARPTVSDLPTVVTNAEIKVGSANVLNFFTTLGAGNFTTPNGTTQQGRGADNATEYTRQLNKVVANLLALNADAVGLSEIQNNGFGNGTSAIDALVDALNATAGAGTYAYIAAPYSKNLSGGTAPTAGDDAINVAIIYKPGKLTPVGAAAVPDVATYDAFTATYGSRVPVAQTFQAVGDGEMFTLVVNHLKSKGSVNDPDQGDGQGNNPLARERAVSQLLTWLGTNPTGSTDKDILLVGDFNAYSKETAISNLLAGGYKELVGGLSYSFDGLWGSLDHVFASNSLFAQATGAADRAINANEPTVLDYNTEFKSAGQISSLYAADAYRSSDHNPILVGLNLAPPEVNVSVDVNSGSEAAATVITITVTASRAVAGAQTVSVAASGTGITGGDYTLSNSTITIADGATQGTLTFTVVDDALIEGTETATLTISNPSAGIVLGSTRTQNIAIADNDTAGITLVQSGGSTDVTEGGATDSYTLVLNTQPTANVTVTLTPNSQVGTSPGSLTFTTANWNVAQTVTVTAVDDAIVEGAHTGSIAHAVTSTDTNYNGLTLAPVTANITDNDSAPLFTSAAVNGQSLVLNYTTATSLDATNKAPTSAFTVLANGNTNTVNTVTVDASAKTVTLTLATAVNHTQTVAVSYTDPTAGNDVAATQDAAGNDAASFTGFAATNNTPNSAPVFTGLDAVPTYTGGTPAIVLDNNATVHDTELGALSLSAGNYGGAVLTIARSGGADAGDVFAGSGNLSLTGGNVVLGGSTIGTDTNAGGSLAITFASGTTEAQVNDVLQKIAYSYTGNSFGTTATLAFNLSDGNTLSQGSGGLLSGLGSVAVSLVAGAPVATGGSTGSDNLVGTSYSNTLNGLGGDDTLTGNIGPDRLNGGSGNDTMTGGDGDDVYVVDSTGDVIVEGSGAGSGIDTVESQLTTYTLGANLENLTYVGALSFTGTGNAANNTLTGGSSNDSLSGGDGNDILFGAAGLDTLNGGTGNDKLYGGLGNDVLIGGTGNDEYYFDTALSLTNVDRINDFSAADDTIYLDHNIFGAAGQAGQLSAAAFGTGSYATTSAQRIIFNTVDKTVSYDADGSGSGAAVRFVALLGTTGTVTAADFWVY